MKWMVGLVQSTVVDIRKLAPVFLIHLMRMFLNLKINAAHYHCQETIPILLLRHMLSSANLRSFDTV